MIILDPTNSSLQNSSYHVRQAIAGLTPTSFAHTSIINLQSRDVDWQEFVLDDKYLISFGKDVSKEKKLERQYSFLISNAQEAIYIASYDGKFKYGNQAMESIVEYTLEELKQLTFTDLIHHEDLERVRAFYSKQLRNLDSDTMLEFRIKTKSGQTKWINQSVKAVRNPKKPNHISEFHCISRDTTVRRTYEKQLDRLSLVARKTKNVIIIMDKSKRIEWVNDAFVDTFGYSKDEAIGKVPGTLLNGPKTNLEKLAQIDMSLKMQRHTRAQLLNYTKAGKEIWMEIILDPIIGSEGELQGYIGVEQEITDRKQKELIIEQQNQDLVDSLHYSRRIQDSTITQTGSREKILAESSVIYRPKDIVSGDFYLVDKLRNSEMSNWPVFLVADCTGHGVPGALLSVLCSSIIKQSFQVNHLSNLADILDYARINLQNFLVQQNER